MPKGIYEHTTWSDERKKKHSLMALELGYGSWMKGKRATKTAKENISRALKGKYVGEKSSQWGKHWDGINVETRLKNAKELMTGNVFRKGLIPWNKGVKTGIAPWLGKKRPDMEKERHWFWKGGVTPINEKIRKSLEYKIWRKSVFERDNYTCVWCGNKGGKLHADHIKPFSVFVELRFSVDNGRTLCKECHLLTETWGTKANNFTETSLLEIK